MASRPPAHIDVAINLALAIVEASDAPLLILDLELKVVAASTSFCQAFALDPALVEGRRLASLGSGEWDVDQLRSLLTATTLGHAAVESYEMDLKPAGLPIRRLAIKARRLHYGSEGPTRLLVTVVDLTDARAAERLRDELIRERAVLVQEIQHRVANSLQIIASVLMQSARKTQSLESRAHLQEAHHRVMSVAAMQRQLANSQLGDVELRPYFTELCASIGASMIGDRSKLDISVSADESVVASETSVSLGLIVTELVINALKHAFPDDRRGKIIVSYGARGPNWLLTVKDDGVGMCHGDKRAKPGLGSGIIEALARQLKATVSIEEQSPGTAVRVDHTSIATVPN